MAQTIVALSGVSKTYRLGAASVHAVAGVSLQIARGDFIAIAGPSGSGKTTLLNIIGCIDKPDEGRIVMDGIDVTPLPLHRLTSTRRDTLGFIFQTFNLIPVLTAYENVEYPLLLKGLPRREREERVRHWLDQVGLAKQMQRGIRRSIGPVRHVVGRRVGELVLGMERRDLDDAVEAQL